jgi:thioredoxin-dependent peroxiredoxin
VRSKVNGLRFGTAMQQPEAYLGAARTSSLTHAANSPQRDGTRTFLRQFIESFANWIAIHLKPGDAAPDLTVDAALGGKEFTFSLADALKKGPVVLYFYPKSFTSVCTIEAHEPKTSRTSRRPARASLAFRATKIDVQRDFSTKECRDKFPVGPTPVFR